MLELDSDEELDDQLLELLDELGGFDELLLEFAEELLEKYAELLDELLSATPELELDELSLLDDMSMTPNGDVPGYALKTL